MIPRDNCESSPEPSPCHNVVNRQASSPKPEERPLLPRLNNKIISPSPPQVISDRSGKSQFNLVGLLGVGGFSRVYQVEDQCGVKLACKVVDKFSLRTRHARQKLSTEIKIHQSLEHPNIVGLREWFQDCDNVYIILELCPNGSLFDLLRRRRRFTEPEVCFFMVQLIGACHFMHTHQVIHRDFKLGNLFLDANMNIKVGDFGLAVLIKDPENRERSVCGTPNYIAPEVLFDTINGHSFEADTWSIGVILYTFLVGRPPFQMKDVKSIYRRIRDNDYSFPVGREISPISQDLIRQILTPDPKMRPTLHEIIEHPFFVEGTVPSCIPISAYDVAPDFGHVTRTASELNLKNLRRSSLLDQDHWQVTTTAVRRVLSSSNCANGAFTVASAMAKGMMFRIAQRERWLRKAVQLRSQISALLSSSNNTVGRDKGMNLVQRYSMMNHSASFDAGLDVSQVCQFEVASPKYVRFGHRRIYIPPTYVGGDLIKNVEAYRYLGIAFRATHLDFLTRLDSVYKMERS